MENPYVISAELDLVDQRLARVIDQSRIDNFRETLDINLRKIGKQTVWVSSGAIQQSLSRSADRTKLPVVSLDDRYMKSADEFLGISRGVNELLTDVGYVPRAGYATIERQIARASLLSSEVVLADDVLFSGEMLTWVAEKLRNRNVNVAAVVVGVAIQEGVDKLQQEGIEVEAGTVFESVDDEICERDFVMVPGSGRRVSNINANALYFDTLKGKPSVWASIPTDKTEFFAYMGYSSSNYLLKEGIRFEELGHFYGWPKEGAVQPVLDEAEMWAYARATGTPLVG